MHSRQIPRLLVFSLLLFAVLALTPRVAHVADAISEPTPPAWGSEFEALCARTPEVMSLSREALQQLVAECDRMQPLVEALPESPRKVYRKRLELTRKLLLFALEAKTQPPATQ